MLRSSSHAAPLYSKKTHQVIKADWRSSGFKLAWIFPGLLMEQRNEGTPLGVGGRGAMPFKTCGVGWHYRWTERQLVVDTIDNQMIRAQTLLHEYVLTNYKLKICKARTQLLFSLYNDFQTLRRFICSLERQLWPHLWLWNVCGEHRRIH